jgi:tRNA 2-thiouridine synthesizing protein A
MAHHTLDARGQLCPMPVIRTQQEIKALAPGDTLEVLCTDPGVKEDIPAWCRVNGHEVVSIVEEHNEIRVTVKVSDWLHTNGAF